MVLPFPGRLQDSYFREHRDADAKHTSLKENYSDSTSFLLYVGIDNGAEFHTNFQLSYQIKKHHHGCFIFSSKPTKKHILL